MVGLPYRMSESGRCLQHLPDSCLNHTWLEVQIVADDQSTSSDVRYKIIPDFHAYRVGTDGTVWTRRRKGGNDRGPDRYTNVWRLMKLHIHNGYFRVNLVRDGVNQSRAVHCLVLEAFVGPCPPGMEACHFPDPTRSNNNLSNLRWDTHTENMRDKYRHHLTRTEKCCRRCGVLKPLSDFYTDHRSLDGHHTNCKPCHQQLTLTTLDPDKRRKANREWMRRWKKQMRENCIVQRTLFDGLVDSGEAEA
jgi:hypothetical protein